MSKRDRRSQSQSAVISTPLERFYLRKLPDQSMVIRVTVRLGDTIDLGLLRKAWQETALDHVRLHSVIVGKGHRRTWQPDRDRIDESFIEAISESVVKKQQDLIRPDCGLGACLVVVRSKEKTNELSLHFLLHHSVCDGVGAAQIIGQFNKRLVTPDWQPSDSPSQSSLSAEVSDSKNPNHHPTQPPAVSGTGVPDLRNLWTTIRGHNASLGKPGQCIDRDDESISSLPVSLKPRVRLPASTAGGLRRYLKEHQIHFNDFGIAVTLHALDTVIRPAPGRHLCVLNPVDLRRWEDRRATNNHMGFACIRRVAGQLRSLVETMRDVADQMDMVRRYGTAREMLQGMAIMERVPLGYRVLDQLGMFVPTATVSSLGALKYGKRFGVEKVTNSIDCEPQYQLAGAKVNDFEIASPLAPHSTLTITLWETSDALSIYFHCVADAAVETQVAKVAQYVTLEIQRLADASTRGTA